MKYILAIFLFFTAVNYSQVDTLNLDTVKVMYIISTDSLELVRIDSIFLADMKLACPDLRATQYGFILRNLTKAEWALQVDLMDLRLPFRSIRSQFKVRLKRTLPDKYFNDPIMLRHK